MMGVVRRVEGTLLEINWSRLYWQVDLLIGEPCLLERQTGLLKGSLWWWVALLCLEGHSAAVLLMLLMLMLRVVCLLGQGTTGIARCLYVLMIGPLRVALGAGLIHDGLMAIAFSMRRGPLGAALAS